jgi:hypothetical protein
MDMFRMAELVSVWRKHTYTDFNGSFKLSGWDSVPKSLKQDSGLLRRPAWIGRFGSVGLATRG